MKYKSIAILFSILVSFSGYCQVKAGEEINAFSRAWVFSLEGGATFGNTDYQRSKPAAAIRGSIEYYFKKINNNVFALKLNLGLLNVSGEDDREFVGTKDGVINIPSPFVTDVYSIGLALSYSYSFEDKYFPYVQLGISTIWYGPKDENGNILINNSKGLYKSSTPAYEAGFGIKYLLTDIISLNISGGIHLPATDYLDDITAGSGLDSYYTIMFGVSVSPFLPSDEDKDGILDEFDECPQDPEDFDGFQDEDGCPDYDNDQDGIPDLQDACPNSAEDFDGFADSDGCPDFDNDQDGIPDSTDDCPNQPETINGFEDEDGCPDQVQIVSVNEIMIFGRDLFYDNTATIKPEGIGKLNEVLEIIVSEPDSRWRIEGHMDSQGAEQYIRNMSSDRAEAVLRFFIFKGISGSRFTIYGMGDDFPIGDNTTADGRQKNRRVEIIRE
ncbi:MAG: OmpA family protein [Bacteroidetes bacterium]|nr:OmpA family protein [Bacteroidota bacterium]